MYELIILALLVVVIVLSLRSGKPIQPLIVDSPGRYYLTLAPQLAHERAFLERITELFLPSTVSAGDLSALYCTVTTKYQGEKSGQSYLLAIALRRGKLYFQAIGMPPDQHDPATRLRALRAFSDAVLAELPVPLLADASSIEVLRDAVEQAAAESGRDVEILG